MCVVLPPHHTNTAMSSACALLFLAVCLASVELSVARLVLRWSDEFKPCNSSRCVNGGIDTNKWGFDLGDGSDFGESLRGWGNWQRQCHTNNSGNARVERMPNNPKDGMLVIQGLHHPDGWNCQNVLTPNVTANYTSARLHTRGKAAFRWRGTPGNASTPTTPIRIDIRYQVPLANGTWPAAYLLPDTQTPWCLGCGPYGNGWCLGGEIDILEHVNERRSVIGNVHYGGRQDASWLDCKENVGTVNLGAGIADRWQLMSLVWDSTYIRFLNNGAQFHQLNLGNWTTGGAPNNPYAPFDVPFYLVLDMALGGLYPGFNIDAGKVPFRYKVDYVRVFEVLP